MKTYLNITTTDDKARIELTESEGKKRLLIQQQNSFPQLASAGAIEDLDENMAKHIIAALQLAFPNLVNQSSRHGPHE